MLRFLAGPAAVGQYAAATRLSEVWYFIPVALLGLIPWTVLILAALYENTRVVWAERKYGIKAEDEYNIFLLIWLFLPIVFFSISNSNLTRLLCQLPVGGHVISG
jgi:4-amino-4-deoxy-L-arabinose transferase-like glycosyltransferase